MEFNWEDFKNGKIAVHCETEKEAKKFIKMANKNGMKWELHNKFHTNWEICGKNTYYVYTDGALMYGSILINVCELPIIEFSDVINFKEDNKMELKEGMIIECRNGDRFLLREKSGQLIGSNFDEWIKATYDEELNENEYYQKEFDIMKIYESKAYVLTDLFDNNRLTCIWERKEPKKMTLAQISEALGYEVEVIDNE